MKPSSAAEQRQRSPVATYVETLSRIPAEARSFTVEPGEAETRFGIAPELQAELVKSGLLHEDGPRFAECDLHYVGLRLGVARTYLITLRTWARALRRYARAARTRASVEVYVAATDSISELDVRIPGGFVRRPVRSEREPIASFGADQIGTWPDLGPAVRSMALGIAESLEFCWLPDAIREDLDFVRETGLGDCASATALAMEACDEAGVPARRARGLIMAAPFASSHNWTEVRVEGEWVPIDPMLIALLLRFGGLDPGAWDPGRSPGSLFCRLALDRVPLVSSDGVEVAASFGVRLAS